MFAYLNNFLPFVLMCERACVRACVCVSEWGWLCFGTVHRNCYLSIVVEFGRFFFVSSVVVIRCKVNCLAFFPHLLDRSGTDYVRYCVFFVSSWPISMCVCVLVVFFFSFIKSKWFLRNNFHIWLSFFLISSSIQSGCCSFSCIFFFFGFLYI